MNTGGELVQRVFLDWREAALPATARWLASQCATSEDAAWDFSRYVLVTPGGRAGRRLLELLIEHAGERPLLPPTIITLGDLPEQLYTSDAVASDAACLLARVHALRHADAHVIQQLVPEPWPREDFNAWVQFAQELETLDAALAAEGLTADAVGPRLAEALSDFSDERRWQAIAYLQRDYEQLLAERGCHDRHCARQAAIEQHRCASDKRIILIAAVDLNHTLRAMLQQVADKVTVLIHAPASHAEGFDALGALVVDYWEDRAIDLPETMIRAVDQPRDQAGEVLRLLTQLGEGGACPYAADQITVGVGDETLAPTLERMLDLAGAPVHRAGGRSVSLSGPVMLLRTMARFIGGRRRFDDFAALLRHSDVETYLTRRLGDIDEARQDWLTLLDEYATQTLQRRLTGAWLGDDATRSAMKRLYQAMSDLLPDDADARLALPQWAQAIAAMLTRLYDCALDRHDDEDGPLVRALEMVGAALRETAQLDADDAAVPQVTLAQAMEWVVSRLAGQEIPQQSRGPAVELLGWLELQLDDAPVLMVTGFNEGAIPQSRTADAFLPDGVRRVLGLADNRRRLARDRMALEAMIASREHTYLIAGRRSSTGDPLKPSRLLLMTDPATLAPRLERFYAEHSDAEEDAAMLLLAPGKVSGFHMPPPWVDPGSTLQSLRVTAFRDYIACPYRFYLRHVRRLDEVDDRAFEMDALRFGSMAHKVLDALGRSDVAQETDSDAIAAFLSDALDKVVKHAFGKEPPVAVMLQREQLRYRLAALARWHADQAAQGWRIHEVECGGRAELNIDGSPFTITGRIDRIDMHDQLGYRVIDYKTGDSPKSPEQVHRTGPRGDRQWVDLQLPLYRHLLAAAGMIDNVSLGYVQLPKDVSRVGFDEAPWTDDELAEAFAVAEQVIRDIRAGRFWPPGDTPQYGDAFTGICMDDCLGRSEALMLAARLWREARQRGEVSDAT